MQKIVGCLRESNAYTEHDLLTHERSAVKFNTCRLKNEVLLLQTKWLQEAEAGGGQAVQREPVSKQEPF